MASDATGRSSPRRGGSPVLTWSYLILWLSGVVVLFTGMTLYSVYFIRWIEDSEGTYAGSVMKQGLIDAGKIRYQILTDAEKEKYGLEVAAADRAGTLPSPSGHHRRLASAPSSEAFALGRSLLEAGHSSHSPAEHSAALAEETADGSAAEEGPLEPMELKPTFRLNARSTGIFMYLCITVPIGWVGLIAILLSSFPSTSVFAPKVSSVQRGINRLFSSRVLMQLSLGDVMLWTWYIFINVAYFAYTAEPRAEGYAKWNGNKRKDIHGFNESQYHLEWVAYTLARVYVLQAPFLFLALARGSLLTTFLGVKYSVGIKWHRWIGYVTFFTLFLHGFLYDVLWISAGILGKIGFKWEYYGVGHGGRGVSNLSGQLSLLAFIVLVATSIPYVRRNFYKVFYFSHIICMTLFFVFGIIHWQYTIEYMYASLGLYGVDVVYRLIQSCHTVDVVTQLSENGSMVTMSIQIEDGVEVHDGAEVWICVPKLGRMDYHPFSIASSTVDKSTSGHIMVHTKVYDKWTKKLAALAQTQGVIAAHVNGPYEGENIHKSETVELGCMAFFTGGVGIAGVLAMLKRLAKDRETKSADDTIPPVELIFVSRQASELQLLSAILPSANHTNFIIRVYYTGKEALQSGFIGKDAVTHKDVAAELGAKGVDSGSGSGRTSDSGWGLRALPALQSSRWEFAAVWVTTFVLIFFFQSLGESYKKDIRTQLGLKDSAPYVETSIVKLCYIIIACLLVPLAVALPIRTIARAIRSFRTPAARGEVPSLAPVAVTVSEGGTSTVQSTEAGSVALPITMGRPDIVGLMKEMDQHMPSGSVLGLYLAGPEQMNDACYTAAKSVSKTSIHQLTYQL